MNKSVRAGLATAIVAFGMGAAVSACGPTHSVQIDAAAKANYEAIAVRCGLNTASGQIAAAKAVKAAGSLKPLLLKCGVPEEKVPDAETKILNAAEHAHLLTKDGRKTFFGVTFPKIVAQEQA